MYRLPQYSEPERGPANTANLSVNIAIGRGLGL